MRVKQGFKVPPNPDQSVTPIVIALPAQDVLCDSVPMAAFAVVEQASLLSSVFWLATSG